MESNAGLPWPFSNITVRHPRGTFFEPDRVDHHAADHLPKVLAAIRAGINHVDDMVGELLQSVDLDNTLVVFLSDHGDYGGHRGYLGKIPWLPFDDIARVPFFMAGAGVSGGRRVQEPVQSFDAVATVLERVGLPAPCSDLDSQSLWGVLEGRAPVPERPVFCGTLEGSPMLRRGRYKHIWHTVANVHILYDLESDPGETHNLAAEPRHRGLLDANVDTLQTMLARPVPPLWRGPAR
jgi:choline-sulfatase